MLDVAIRQTSSKLQEELKKKSTNDQKDYEKKTLSLKHPQLLIGQKNLVQSTQNYYYQGLTSRKVITT